MPGNPISSRPDAKPAASLPGIPLDSGEPVFREPWEAQAFAMALALHERGVFTWAQWATALAEEIRSAQAAGDPDLDTTIEHAQRPFDFSCEVDVAWSVNDVDAMIEPETGSRG